VKDAIVIANATESLELRGIDKQTLLIIFRGDGVSFEAKPYLYEDADELVAFFAGLAEDWQGWTGIRSWSSVEGDFKIDASHNGHGEVLLKVSLQKIAGDFNKYQFVGGITVEPGSLGEIASQIKKVLLANNNSIRN
jgi:hypothetical protein